MKGIYQIKSKSTGRYYVGSSINIFKRIKRHKYDLNNNSHHNIFLQRAWMKYGQEDFEFNILEIVTDLDPLILTIKEQSFINLAITNGNSYNTCPVAGTCAGVKQSESTKRKRALKLLGTKRTPEQRARISTARRAVGITKKHMETLKYLAYKRRKRISNALADEACSKHNNGDTWESIARAFNIGTKQLRRELRAIVGDSYPKPIKRRIQRNGESHSMSKLKNEDVLLIFSSPQTVQELANRFYVTKACIYDIKERRTWRHTTQ